MGFTVDCTDETMSDFIEMVSIRTHDVCNLKLLYYLLLEIISGETSSKRA